MRTTVRLDDDLLLELKERARRENLTLTGVVNRLLRRGLQASEQDRQPSRRFRERGFEEGVPSQMKIVDLNVLLYAINKDSVHHRGVHEWWESAVNGDQPVGLPWIVLAGLSESIDQPPRVFSEPFATEQAMERVDAWLSHPNVKIVRKDRSTGIL